jgi:uncharacterized protein YecE (DUF72 family)
MPEKPVLTKEERRARREARREKQREQNLGRAEKMHQARENFEQQVKSPTPSRAKDTKKPVTKYHVGCSGWFYWHWRDHFYLNIPTKDWFNHYNSHFNTVELNAPFYSWPTIATVKTWSRQVVKPQFVYTVKVNELITHTRRFEGTKQLVKDFGLIADLLGKQMGCFLFQLPPGYHYTPARLADILSQLDHQRRNVVEFRHRSWWNEQVYSAFRQTKTIFCSCSGPRLPDELIKTADDIYIRFHGTEKWYRHNYTREELAVWIDRIKKTDAKQVWAYFNNDMDGYAITNAKEFLRQLKRRPARKVGIPSETG